MSDSSAVLQAILQKLSLIETQQATLIQRVDELSQASFRVYAATPQLSPVREDAKMEPLALSPTGSAPTSSPAKNYGAPVVADGTAKVKGIGQQYNRRIILTTYPGGVGINPIPLKWGASEAVVRGPIVASRNAASLKLRNAIGAHGGAYSIYRALAVAIGQLEVEHKPDLTNTEPVFNFPPQPGWFNPDCIVSMDPWGHVPQLVFASQIKEGLDIRPTIAITKAHMQLVEIEALVTSGSIPIDGTVVLNKSGQLMVTKGAVEPVWHLPGMAKRFGVDENTLRRALFEDTGGMYPELITRQDLKIFLPPIGGLSIYIFGNPAYLSDPTKKLTLRVHDECNGSDVFGSDICTCRPYLIYGIAECVRAAQQGGVGLIVYFRKEGRALGEVTKYLVYNARKRAEGGDTAQAYFKRTENIAGVKDMRFQATMPDVLHWLGITRIDRMVSMSDMKYNAIVGSGIEIVDRIEIPDDMLPPDSQVEIDAKIAAGYFSSHRTTLPAETKGRTWDDVIH